MSMTTSAVLCGPKSPSNGQGYGSDATVFPPGTNAASIRSSIVVDIRTSLGNRKFARRLAGGALRPRRGDHDEEREDVRRCVPEVVALRHPHRLKRGADGPSGAEQQRRPDAADRIPARE